MNIEKYFRDLMQYQYFLGDAEELDELLLVAA
jgi:hypothetical protein